MRAAVAPSADKQFAEKLDLCCSAPKGASDFKRLVVSLKRYPDTKLSFSAICKAGTENKAFLAAVNRCTSQKQRPKSSFSANCLAGEGDSGELGEALRL
ncbi:MAG: hypothetical protein WBP91_03600 [Terriglobales bacterium]